MQQMNDAAQIEDRISTGVEGLDELLMGGLRPGSSLLIEGAAGTGKSTIALQFLLAGIERGEPGVYISTEETPSRVYRDASSFGWDLRKLESENKLRVIGTSAATLSEQLQQRGPLMQTIREAGARRAVVDTITMLQGVVDTSEKFREVLRGIITALDSEGIQTLLIRDAEPEMANESFSLWARFTVDALAQLEREWAHERLERRVISVVKARGQEIVHGKHGYKITGDGVQVYARVLPPFHMETEFQVRRYASGVEGLDNMLGGGFVRRDPILVSGPTGSGKTTIMLSFLAAGAARGERGLMVSTEETPDRMIAHALGIGLDIRGFVERGLLDVEYWLETETEPDEYLCRIRKKLGGQDYKRVGIDSLNGLEKMSSSMVFAADAALFLSHILTRSNVTPIMSYEMPVISGHVEITRTGVSALVSTIILLRLVEIEGDVKKGISVLKHRNSEHATNVRQFVIDKDGIRVLSGFEGYQGVLTGIPTIISPSCARTELKAA